MVFSKRIKQEREKRGWPQAELAEKLHVSRQSVSKWETGKNLPSIEVLINISDLFGITIDELLRSDKELKEKIINDSKKLAYPKWKMFFDSLFLLGSFLLVSKFIILILSKLTHFEVVIPDGTPKIIINFLPLVLMLIGGIGSKQLKNKYVN